MMSVQKFLSALLVIVVIGMFTSCEVFNPEEQIPSYIHIDKIDLNTTSDQGTNSSKITDAWVYVDDQLIGAYELPATVPILFGGTHTVVIKPGIKVDGISATRAVYPFYKPYTASINLIPDSVITINPTLTYNTFTVFEWKEAFEDGGISIDKTLFSDTTIDKTSDITKVYEGSYSGVVHLDATHDFFQGLSLGSFILPSGDSPVFLELNYKTDALIKVGLYANSTSQIMKLDVLYINKSATWNKIYINLNSAINRATNNPDDFQIYIEIQKDTDASSAEILFDNIKLVHN
jgi:hypothetical protein